MFNKFGSEGTPLSVESINKKHQKNYLEWHFVQFLNVMEIMPVLVQNDKKYFMGTFLFKVKHENVLEKWKHVTQQVRNLETAATSSYFCLRQKNDEVRNKHKSKIPLRW